MFINLCQITSVIIAIIGTTFIIPIITAIAIPESNVVLPFLIPMLISWVAFLTINLPLRKRKIELSIRSSFLIVAGVWLFASFFAAVPLYFSKAIPSFTNAVFESFSGFSTTGATIVDDIEALPRSINLWRCMTHWLGGMGIVALTVALLPLLGVGGFQLIKAETTGPEKGKVTTTITTTAKILWIIYLALTLLQTILLKIAGMDWIDSISHAFATLGTGGFSTKNASIGAYNSLPIDIICTIFMFFAGINFSLHFYAATGRFEEIRKNSELKTYILIILIAVTGITVSIIPNYNSIGKALRYGTFQTLSIITTTGFATADYTTWSTAAQFFIFLLFFVGGCSGSTSGGFKVIRWTILFKQFNNETKQILHPHGVFSLRINGRPSRSDLVTNVTSFFVGYFFLVTLITLCGCFANLDLFTAITGALSMIGNIGPAFGKLGPSCNYNFLPSFLKWIYCFAMLAGRLELYTIIILFVPEYWKNK